MTVTQTGPWITGQGFSYRVVGRRIEFRILPAKPEPYPFSRQLPPNAAR